ncbi:hypothetical protein TrRE_jg4214 [Triparma retinervis]|uniref:Uncharacterized protein n=1 Tax=Triparma retinervis TaxID=2557542 RepID=A0A9W7ARQ9_9STRA|nr:hypothetical protein TrRE_jg4214 [Triparma retinervis]
MKVTHHTVSHMDGPPLSPGAMSPIKFKTSSQRGTFHGTYNKNAARDQKVKDLLLEIEREAKMKMMREQAKEGSKREQAKKLGKARRQKRRREQNIEAKDKEMSWQGNFGFGARLPEYNAEEDRYCPRALARRFNRTTSTVDNTTGQESSPTKLTRTVSLRGTMGGHKVKSMLLSASPPKIMSSATMALSGLILTRSKLVVALKTVLEESESELEVLRASGHEDKAKFPRQKFLDVANNLRVCTIKIVEMIQRWGEKQPDPTAAYLFRNSDYLLEIYSELDFMSTNFRACKAFGFGKGANVPNSHFNGNPFLSPVPLRRTVVEDDTEEAKANPTLVWSAEDDFHACKVRVVGEDVDILQIRDVSMFVISRVEEAVERDEESKRMELTEEESDEADGEEGEQPASQLSPTTAQSKLPFFTLCEFKYSTYLPRRNVLGALDGLDDMELSQGTLRHGTADTFDNKRGRWNAKQRVPLSSERRGTYFGTVPLKIAKEPEVQLRRIVETVPMLQYREKGTKAKVELEELIKYGKGEEKNISLLKDELGKIRDKVNKAKNIYENILNSGRAEKARKFKVKWSFWYEEQEALAKEIKKRAAELFFKKDHLHRLVRIVDNAGERYEVERNKAIAELKRRAAMLEKKKQRVVVVIQRWAKGVICRTKLWPILMEKIMAATKIANLQRAKEARRKVKARRQEHKEQTEASVLMQGIIRRKQAKVKVNEVRLEKKKQNQSAMLLQQKARQRLAKQRVASKRQERKESHALIKIQTRARSGLAAKEAERRRRRRMQNAALLVMQCWSRVTLAHKRVARRIEEIEEQERLAELKRQEEEKKRVEAERLAAEERLEKERAEALRKIEEREKLEEEARLKKEAENREREERERAEEERLRVQKEREEWRRIKEAEAEEYRQLMLSASKEEAEKLKAEKEQREEEDREKEAKMIEAEEDAAFGEDDHDFVNDDNFSIAESIGSLEGSHLTEEEHLSVMYEWSSLVGEHDEDESHAAHAAVSRHRHREKAMFHAHGQGKDGNYDVLLLDATEHYVEDHLTEIATATASEDNVQHILKSAKTQDGKKAEAFKYLRHRGYQAKVQSALVKRARVAMRTQQKKKLVTLRENQRREVAWLIQQPKRYESFTDLRSERGVARGGWYVYRGERGGGEGRIH